MLAFAELSPVSTILESPVLVLLTIAALVLAIYGARAKPTVLADSDVIIPPTVPSAIPWLGNMFHYAYNRGAFLSRCGEQYGDIYKMTLAGRSSIFMRSPALVVALMRRSQQLTFYPVRGLVHSSAFKMSVAAATSSSVDDEVYPVAFHPYYSKALMRATTNVYGQQLLREFRALVARKGPQFDIALHELIFPLSFRASSRTSFGETFPVEQAYADFMAFDEGFSLLASGLPTVLFPRYRKARDNLLALMTEHTRPWLDAFEDGPRERILGCEVGVAMRRAGWSAQDTVGHLLAFLWGSQGNTLWTMFWALGYVLTDGARTAAVRAEVDRILREDCDGTLEGLVEADPDVLGAQNAPLLESMVKETLRTCADFPIVRIAKEDTVLNVPGGQSYLVRKGEWVFGLPVSVHNDPEVYERPEEFHLDRFVDDDGKSIRKFYKDGKRIDNNLMFWGGGEHACKGRFVAEFETKLFLIFVLYLLNPTSSYVVKHADGAVVKDSIMPRKTQTHIGLLHSDEDLVIRCSPQSAKAV